MQFLGGTVIAAIELIKERGIDNKQIKVVRILKLFSFLFSIF